MLQDMVVISIKGFGFKASTDNVPCKSPYGIKVYFHIDKKLLLIVYHGNE